MVGGVVYHESRVLILRRSATAFMAGIEELPSGGVGLGEDLLTALRRELAEEIAWSGPLTIDPGFVASFDYVSGSGRKTRQYTFGVPCNGHHVRLSAEHSSFRWVELGSLDDCDFTDESARTIRDWATARH